MASKTTELSDRKNKKLDLERQLLDIRSEFSDRNRSDYATLISDFEAQYASLKYAFRSSQNLRITAPQTGYVTALKKLHESNIGNTYMKGKKHSEETKRKMSEATQGQTHSEETRRKIGEANKNTKWWNDGCGNRKRMVECPGNGWKLGRK